MYKSIVIGVQRFTKTVDKVNRAIGHVAMYLLVAMVAILIWSVCTNAFNSPAIWVMEMAQFTMAAYYLVGAAFSMQEEAHVRMDFLYERWGKRKRSLVDSITSVALVFYLIMLVYGGWTSSAYAVSTGQTNHTVWAPYMAPIKIAMTFGMALMLLQSLSELAKDIFRACGKELHEITFDEAPERQVAGRFAPALTE
ncbi:MAG: TRAP transporter small permease subunit [Acidobacteriota bacterium]|jgi:TRAP-type mannitol/chloroaromatic compound transport system permease small subunit|nr:TRAP transporter small permease subunit [Acidobacteriota bacterium]